MLVLVMVVAVGVVVDTGEGVVVEANKCHLNLDMFSFLLSLGQYV